MPPLRLTASMQCSAVSVQWSASSTVDCSVPQTIQQPSQLKLTHYGYSISQPRQKSLSLNAVLWKWLHCTTSQSAASCQKQSLALLQLRSNASQLKLDTYVPLPPSPITTPHGPKKSTSEENVWLRGKGRISRLCQLSTIQLPLLIIIRKGGGRYHRYHHFLSIKSHIVQLQLYKVQSIGNGHWIYYTDHLRHVILQGSRSFNSWDLRSKDRTKHVILKVGFAGNKKLQNI